jgi:hypothetical protein
MGIPKFLNYLKANYNSSQWYDSQQAKNPNRKWDYIILDYQSLIYSNYNAFSNDINYFIRIIHLDQKLLNTKLINNIILKYPKYFQLLFNKTVTANDIDLLKECDKYNDINIIMETIVDIMVQFTKNLSAYHDKTYVFFDGIPSVAKIKEQVGRRVYPEIMKEITSKLIKSMSDCMEKTIRSKMVPEFPPTIAPGSILVNKLRKLLIENDFFVNKIGLGEAEHMIMTFLEDNKGMFKDKKILLASPDADLILLSLINRTKGFNIDIMRVNTTGYNEMDMNGFVITKDYIYIDKLKDNLKLDSNQKIIDICYLLLLLGDDFVPIINGITIKALPIIIQTYENLCKNTSFHIIDNNKLLYNNFILYIMELSKNIDRLPQKEQKRNFLPPFQEFQNYSKFFFIEDFCRENNKNFEIIQKIYFLNSGFINVNNKYISLLNRDGGKHNHSDNNIIENYLEGCDFIFELYINNTINDYRWFYRYETAPSLISLYKYMMNHPLPKIILHTKHYMDTIEYVKYVDLYKKRIIMETIYKINKKYHTENSRKIVDENNYNKLKIKYLTYDNVKYLFNCDGKMYFNKCVIVSNPQLDF